MSGERAIMGIRMNIRAQLEIILVLENGSNIFYCVDCHFTNHVWGRITVPVMNLLLLSGY